MGFLNLVTWLAFRQWSSLWPCVAMFLPAVLAVLRSFLPFLAAFELFGISLGLHLMGMNSLAWVLLWQFHSYKPAFEADVNLLRIPTVLAVLLSLAGPGLLAVDFVVMVPIIFVGYFYVIAFVLVLNLLIMLNNRRMLIEYAHAVPKLKQRRILNVLFFLMSVGTLGACGFLCYYINSVSADARSPLLAFFATFLVSTLASFNVAAATYQLALYAILAWYGVCFFSFANVVLAQRIVTDAFDQSAASKPKSGAHWSQVGKTA